MNPKKSRLIEIVTSQSFQSGPEVTLASGRASRFYFDMKPTLFDPEGAGLVADLVLDALDPVDADFIGGLELGAVPIAAAVAAASHARTRPLRGFFVRKEAKAHGMRSLIEGLGPSETLAGKRVVIVEDVTTTGGSALKAAEVVSAAGGQVVQVVTIVDREEGAAEAFAARGLAFTALLRRGDFIST